MPTRLGSFRGRTSSGLGIPGDDIGPHLLPSPWMGEDRGGGGIPESLTPIPAFPHHRGKGVGCASPEGEEFTHSPNGTRR